MTQPKRKAVIDALKHQIAEEKLAGNLVQVRKLTAALDHQLDQLELAKIYQINRTRPH